MARRAKGQRLTRYRALAQGVGKRWMAAEPKLIAGRTYTPQQLVDELQALLDAIDATTMAFQTWRATLARERALEKSRRAFVRNLEVLIRAQSEGDATALADFGLEPAKKTGPKTVAVKAAAAEKGAATRKERGTTGPRPKKKRKAT